MKNVKKLLLIISCIICSASMPIRTMENDNDAAAGIRFAAELFGALRTGNTTFVQEWIDSGGDINTYLVSNYLDDDEEGTDVSPLFFAAFYGQTEMVNLLCANHADLNIGLLSEEGVMELSPLHAAITQRKPETAQALIAKGANINQETGDGCMISPLQLTILYRQPEIAQMLFVLQPDTEYTDAHGLTALHYAALYNMPDIVQSLSARYVSINATDRFGLTSLFYAVSTGNLPMVQVLIKAGANRFAQTHQGNTLLHYAAELGISLSELPNYFNIAPEYDEQDYANVFAYLLSMGLDPQQCNNKGYTPLHTAAASNGELIIEHMLRLKNINPNALTSTGQTALHVAAKYNSSQSLAILLGCTKDIDARDHKGRTALYHAAKQNDELAIERLLAMGTNPNIPDNEGNTPLHVAAEIRKANEDAPPHIAEEINKSKRCIITKLLKANANINPENIRGETPLHKAATAENIELLMNCGANVIAKDKFGIMPGTRIFHARLHFAQSMLNVVANGTGEYVATHIDDIVQRNIFPYARAHNGNTAMHLAIQKSNPHALQALLKYFPTLTHVTNASGETPMHYAFGTQMLYIISEHARECKELEKKYAGVKTPEKPRRSQARAAAAPYKKGKRPR